MPKVSRIYKTNTREQIACLPNVGAQKRQLIEILESIKPAVLVTNTTCDAPPALEDLGFYFQVFKDRKYELKVECFFANGENDSLIHLVFTNSNITSEFRQYGYCFSSSGASGTTQEAYGSIPPYIGITWAPPTESAVTNAYGTMLFQLSENAIINLQFLAGSGDTAMLAGSNFTLTEIESNDE